MPEMVRERGMQRRPVWTDRGVGCIRCHWHGSYFLEKAIDLLDSNNKEYITEIIREKILDCIHDEIPYQLNIKVDSLKQKQNNVVIYSTIYLNKASHKPIILGKKGQTIKKIGIEARNELEKIFKKKYHLYIFLKPIKSLKGRS